MEPWFKKNPLVFVSMFSILFGVVGGGLSSYALLTYFEFGQEDETVSTGDVIINFENGSYHEVWEKAAPAVVSVVALKDLSEYYDQFSFFNFPGFEVVTPEASEGDGELEEVSSGSGFIITPDGLVVTNKHVVEDDTAEYLVILADGAEFEAQILDKDPLNDIALLQIIGDEEELGDLPDLDFADSDKIQVGDPVIAIGNALGEYSNTTTAGIISATGRDIVASLGYGFGAETLVNLLQTDAAINSGNSGGPLLNLNAEVVGMNTAVYQTAEGIGFAIPSNDIASVVASYQEFGRIVRPFIGVRYVLVTEQRQKRFELGVDHGALIIGDEESGEPGVVLGSPAEKAGIKEGDVILSVNGKELTETFTLANSIASYLVGDTINLEVYRDGDTISLKLTLEENTE